MFKSKVKKCLYSRLLRSCVLLFVFLVLLLFQNQFYRIKPKKVISPQIKNKLIALGEKALLHNDVPVAAIITYNDSIIGEGYNSVYRDGNISNHAEIIALSDVFKKYGQKFYSLDREKLDLYTTFEPCEMCSGAIVHYNIKNIYFEQNKSVSNRIKSTLKSLCYNLGLIQFNEKGLQEGLFQKHPDYKNQHHGN
ncbi:MAG: nucleoside deaminase [Flavobacteriales bacterium]